MRSPRLEPESALDPGHRCRLPLSTPRSYRREGLAVQAKSRDDPATGGILEAMMRTQSIVVVDE